ncbi:hypothetical protein BaRGS_00019180 [Batillaria attramentaria]|uniref:Uncharacterized protein n=1 Tax=Batillaria attramentaria TaxID=370345 RepID=A0ABD0KRF8_9CAEN
MPLIVFSTQRRWIVNVRSDGRDGGWDTTDMLLYYHKRHLRFHITFQAESARRGGGDTRADSRSSGVESATRVEGKGREGSPTTVCRARRVVVLFSIGGTLIQYSQLRTPSLAFADTQQLTGFLTQTWVNGYCTEFGVISVRLLCCCSNGNDWKRDGRLSVKGWAAASGQYDGSLLHNHCRECRLKM